MWNPAWFGLLSSLNGLKTAISQATAEHHEMGLVGSALIVQRVMSPHVLSEMASTPGILGDSRSGFPLAVFGPPFF